MVLKENTSVENKSRSLKHSKNPKRNYSDKSREKLNSINKILILSIASILSLSLVILSFIMIPKLARSPEDTIIKFSEKFNDGRYKEMLRYVEPSEAKNIRDILDMLPSEISENALETILPFVSDITNTKLYPDIINTQIEKNRAVITVQLKSLDDNNYYDVYLTKKKGIWYIKYFWIASENK